MAEKISNDLIDTGSIAQMLGVTRIHATSSITKQPGFPRPRVNLSQRPPSQHRHPVFFCRRYVKTLRYWRILIYNLDEQAITQVGNKGKS